MPGFLGGGQNAGQPKQPFGPQLKQALISAAPLFSSMAAGYSSGRGPYAYLDQGIAGMQAMQKQKRDEEAAAAAAAAFGGLVPGGNAGGTGWGGDGGAYTGSNTPPGAIRAQHGIFGGGEANLSYGREPADTGSVAKGGLSFGPATGHKGFTAYEARYGLPEGYLERTAQIESGGNPNAKNPNSSAGGLFQFIDSTAQQYGLQNKFDPAQATDAAARLAADNAMHLRRVLGREPTAAELYLAHQQGAGGAAKLLANPNARAVDVVGADAVRLNGGDANMTAGQFASKWTGKFGGGGGGTGGGAPAAADPLSDPYVQRLMQVMAMPGLTPEQQSVVQLQLQTRMGQLTAQATPTEYTTFNGPDGTVYRFDKQRGVAEPLTGAEQADPGYRVLTPQEAQAMGLPEGVYQVGPKGEIKPIGGGGTNITVNTGGGPELGKLSTDFGYVMDPETNLPKIDPATGLPTAAPVPGSPAWIEAQRLADKAATGADKEAQTADVVLGKLDELDALVSGSGIMSPATGFGAETLADVGGTRAADTKATIDTIAANMAFDALAEMRAASPTGGALGSITENELALLSSTMASLKQSQSPEQFKRNVAQLREIYTTIRAKADAYPNAAQFGFGGGSPGTAQGATAPITGITSNGVQWSLGE